MKKGSTIFLQVVLALVGVGVLAGLLRFPLTEGRAAKLDVLHVYADPFILYGFAASVPFFIGLYQAFKLLGYIGQNKVFSMRSVKALRTIKYCALVVSGAIILAAIYIKIFHNKDDDPAGFLALSFITTFLSIVIATAATVFEKLLLKAVHMKSENDLTV